MNGRRRKKGPREKDLTGRYFGGDFDEDRVEQTQRFTDRSKHQEQSRIMRTSRMRSPETADDLDKLPVGQVIQVFSLYYELRHEEVAWLAVIRKTLSRVMDTTIVVGDYVRFRATGATTENGQPECVIEQLLPRKTLLTRADSFKGIIQRPIVANAGQMLIVASLLQPRIKWGLIDRMIVAARAGGLVPILCINKIDLADTLPQGPAANTFAQAALAHYATMEISTLQTSVLQQIGLQSLRDRLAGQVTILAGHSGVGKSSLIQAIQPNLDLRTAQVSLLTDKGRHTTTSARRYDLDGGGAVIDTPGVRQFGLWNVTAENLIDFFPDVDQQTAPPWRRKSYERILQSL